MNEQNDTNEDQDIKYWTAKRRATLVIEILRGQTTIADAVRPPTALCCIWVLLIESQINEPGVKSFI